MYNKLFFDIETVAEDGIEEYLPEVSAPANYKDPEKIEKYLIEKRQTLINSAALDPHLGKVIAIGIKTFEGKDEHEEILYASDETMEKASLAIFWDRCAYAAEIVGYNIIDFDLPYLLTRSMALNVETHLENSNFYRDNRIIDLMRILFPKRDQTKSLKFLAKRYGLTGLVPLDVNGSQVKDMTEDEICKYCMSDVILVEQLYNMMEGKYF